MGSPVKVGVPGFRIRTAYVFAYWADRELQEREWIRHQGREPSWDTLCNQLDEIDWIDRRESLAESVGSVVATPLEHYRTYAVDECIERLLTLSDEIDCDWPASVFDHPLWHQANRLSLSALSLFVMNGGCWTGDSFDQDLVQEYPIRGLAAQCLASLAGGGSNDLDEKPPLRRDFDDAISILVNQCSLADPRVAIDRIYRDSDEIPRLERLHGAIQAAEPHEQIATLAAHALTAIVRAWSGWNYDGPIDAGRH